MYDLQRLLDEPAPYWDTFDRSSPSDSKIWRRADDGICLLRSRNDNTLGLEFIKEHYPAWHVNCYTGNEIKIICRNHRINLGLKTSQNHWMFSPPTNNIIVTMWWVNDVFPPKWRTIERKPI